MNQAFEQIYIEHFQAVYRFILSLCRDESLAEELTQDAFFKAIKGIDSFRGDCSLRAWLCQIAKNAYFSHQRRHKRILPEQDAPPDSTPSAESQILSAERTRALHAALHKLNEPFKEVFTLKVFAELPHPDIAKLFGKSESWSRVTYHRAKQQLLKMMEENDI